ncbi:uncharacterized protein LOC125502246 [Athalia rosae]|uniref:uncharacterized protein LOC125502246 n=1 Tax=Athalia rosae TaxID=37344 RepID=UPI00203326AE|nr:uncharacterized protein LOC125502246 [Athalia rosae]
MRVFLLCILAVSAIASETKSNDKKRSPSLDAVAASAAADYSSLSNGYADAERISNGLNNAYENAALDNAYNNAALNGELNNAANNAALNNAYNDNVYNNVALDSGLNSGLIRAQAQSIAGPEGPISSAVVDRVVPVAVTVAQPVEVTRNVAVQVPQYVPIEHNRPVPVAVPQPIAVPVNKHYAVPVDRPIPVLVPHAVRVTYPRVAIPFQVPEPYVASLRQSNYGLESAYGGERLPYSVIEALNNGLNAYNGNIKPSAAALYAASQTPGLGTYARQGSLGSALGSSNNGYNDNQRYAGSGLQSSGSWASPSYSGVQGSYSQRVSSGVSEGYSYNRPAKSW